MFFPSHGEYTNPQVSRRVMDIYQFLNSKTLFKFVRHDARRMAALKPVMVHVNYHPAGGVLRTSTRPTSNLLPLLARVCMSTYPEGKSCFDLDRLLVLNDPTTRTSGSACWPS